MPTIIVRAHGSDGDLGTVTLVERAVPVDLHNEHYTERLIERLAWALHDAERLEARLTGTAADAARRRRSHSPQRVRKPAMDGRSSARTG